VGSWSKDGRGLKFKGWQRKLIFATNGFLDESGGDLRVGRVGIAEVSGEDGKVDQG
jgi:hypothetical protein